MSDDLEIGATFAGYRLEHVLGKGGMGVVYRAIDVRLGRPVALKLVSGDAAAHGKHSLLNEAQAAASLNHPNICTIYSAGEADGRLFIAMEYLEGSDLRTMLKNGPLPWKQAVSICHQVARALEEANGRKIVHRDIKSANIFLTRQGVTKLLDFGLASHSEEPGDTRTIAYFGTPNYMAPERIETGISDHRGDIWSLGVVFYEMLTGAVPFGASGRSVFRSILLEDPAPITNLPENAPPTLTQIVGAALRKDPADRYSSVTEMLGDLGALLRDDEVRSSASSVRSARFRIQPSADEEPRTIAVLPFANVTSDAGDEFISDGLAEEIINGLTGIQGLRVVSRDSSFQCRGTTLTPREVGEKLSASHMVNGSLRRMGDRLRLTVQLSETGTGYLLWSRRFDAGMKDLFDLQDELSAAVLEQLREKLRVRPAGERAKPAAQNQEAYEAYLRGRYRLNRHTEESLLEALECFTRAQKLDPGQARHHIAAAECYAALEWYGLEPASTAVPKLKAALERGLELDPNSFSSLTLLATVQAGYDWDWEAADRNFQRALARGAGSADVWFHYGLDLLTPCGRLEEALNACQTASGLDPLSAITRTAVGGCYYRMHRWSEAAASLRTTLELHPGFGHAHWSLGRTLLELDAWDEALRQFDAAVEVMGPTPEALAELGYGLARAGRMAEAREVLNQLDQMAANQFVSPVHRALVCAGLGDRASAVSHLEEALEAGTRKMAWINADPRFLPLQGESGFRRLLSRMAL